MADITITPASVVAGDGAQVDRAHNAGASVTAGQAVYLDSTDGTWKLADANGAAALRAVRGICLHAAAAGQPLAVQTDGPITIGATVAVGTIYVLSGTAGGIAPAADLTTGWYTSIIGIATTTGIIQLRIYNSGVAVP